MTEQYEIDFRGHRILWINDHASAVKVLSAAGLQPPAIPTGCNTVSAPFTTAGGARALAVNQTGFAREQRDNEQEVNGCSVLVLGETLGSPALDDAVLQAAEEHMLKS